MIPGISQPTLFSRRILLHPSLFMRPMHPKTEIRPHPEAIEKILAAGWVAQLKIHGHRAQIHVGADLKSPILVYNRQGQLHKKTLPPAIASEIRRLFTPVQDWNVIDAEWIKTADKIFVFDFLKKEGESLHRLNFLERWKLLPRAFISPSIQTLGIFSELNPCLQALRRQEDHIEGLVFKSSSAGFEDSSIIRCRR